MAMAVRWLCTCLCAILLVSCGNGDQLSLTDYYKYDVSPSSSLHYSELVLNHADSIRTTGRIKRHLWGEFDTHDLGQKFNLAPSDDEIQGSSSRANDGNATSVNNSKNGTSETEATRITSAPVNGNEPKTGGNYMSTEDAAAMSRGTAVKNPADSNRTTPPATSNTNITDMNATSVTTGKAVNATASEQNNTISANETVGPVQGKTNASVNSDHITIANFPDDNLENVTLADNNITNSKEDAHTYYNSSYKPNDENLGRYFWIDMDNYPNAQTNEMLSQSHRRATTVKLSFDFPFYGHIVRNVTIATGGFLYTGDYVHSWLAATQYIAPLMANFDTSLSNESYVKYVDNGTQFTVQWDKVKLQDKPDWGGFTFQATLKDTGDIIFVYQSVPVSINNITDDNHPVKVGLSDAYIIDRHVLFVRRKTIYEYHRITFEQLSITNWTVISLIALPTCLQGADCDTCLTHDVGFECYWCTEINKCSSGIDRHRQEWIMHECDRHNVNNITQCPAQNSIPEIEKPSTSAPSTPELEVHTEQTVTALLAEESRSVNVSALIGVLFCIGVVLSLSLWALYAYRNPHTTSGQFLIKYRPSQWSWRRGEARYTAATIHM